MTAVRVIGAVVIVLVLVALSARAARRAGVRGPGAGLRVIDRAGLSREASVAVVEVAGRAFVVGVTSHSVNVLSELDAEALARAKSSRQPRPGQPKVIRLAGGKDAVSAIPAQTTREPGRGSGSVLSPATWRQGIEALRDLTARRGPR